MTWDVLNIIGTIAFAISGAIIAMEEDYDILGVFILGLATAFGGGLIRNILIDLPVSQVWQQDELIKIVLIVMTVIFFLPDGWIQFSRRWLNFFDAIGLSTFAIQGALYATDMELPLIAIVVAAVMTGSGGGVVRDLLAGRKPTVLRYDIYAVWAMIAGVVIGTGIVDQPWELYTLGAVIVILRMCSAIYNWKLPHRILQDYRS
ncbi:trimeric intracellular cation channel family protein [Alkalihalobacillus sp. AL-G]|uniref:trimeric intracellular cation channel family protein n=1 Tax=Alkalihalobacillus sp. AL-G TaxID=2926399 RepID=UPI00272DAE4A|nr:trimeric intracellular cation channel family protein [Alkalihalobacillus sp. AL-G]WLD95293.1 trimeric intracellular cation channel family protein [Alkalihalobacillus sp. AL-G]